MSIITILCVGNPSVDTLDPVSSEQCSPLSSGIYDKDSGPGSSITSNAPTGKEIILNIERQCVAFEDALTMVLQLLNTFWTEEVYYSLLCKHYIGKPEL